MLATPGIFLAASALLATAAVGTQVPTAAVAQPSQAAASPIELATGVYIVSGEGRRSAWLSKATAASTGNRVILRRTGAGRIGQLQRFNGRKFVPLAELSQGQRNVVIPGRFVRDRRGYFRYQAGQVTQVIQIDGDGTSNRPVGCAFCNFVDTQFTNRTGLDMPLEVGFYGDQRTYTQLVVPNNTTKYLDAKVLVSVGYDNGETYMVRSLTESVHLFSVFENADFGLPGGTIQLRPGVEAPFKYFDIGEVFEKSVNGWRYVVKREDDTDRGHKLFSITIQPN